MAALIRTFKNTVLPSPQRELGLRQVYPDPADFSKVTNFDIIAIHGLDTQSPTTWVTYKNGKDTSDGMVHWLRDVDMLPERCPDARILTYDWNANFDEDAVQGGLLSHANTLLGQIEMERSEADRTEPIVFIASCFGGLLLAKALHRAATPHSRYNPIYKSTHGILFLGTPFYGSEHGFFTNTFICLEVAIAEGRQTSKELINYLNNSPREMTQLNELVQDFTEMVHNHKNAGEHSPQILCFFEKHMSDFTKVLKRIPRENLPEEHQAARDRRNLGVLVPEHSACIPGYFRMGLDVRHNMLNKFLSPQDMSFRTVTFHLKELTRELQAGKVRRFPVPEPKVGSPMSQPSIDTTYEPSRPGLPRSNSSERHKESTRLYYLSEGRKKLKEFQTKSQGKGDEKLLEMAIDNFKHGATILDTNGDYSLPNDSTTEINILLATSYLEQACLRVSSRAKCKECIKAADRCLTIAQRTNNAYLRRRAAVQRARWRTVECMSHTVPRKKGIAQAVQELTSVQAEVENCMLEEMGLGGVEAASEYEPELQSVQELIKTFNKMRS